MSLLRDRVGPSFSQAIDLILKCQGLVVVTGMGKAGIIGQKISATFASTGTPSIFLHPAEAAHGDLGRIRQNDLLLALSNSGGTEEVLRLLNPVKKLGSKIIAVTGDGKSPLARHADCVVDIGSVDEACPLGLAPTASTTALLAIGDALAMVTSSERKFSKESFALFHPAGSLGRELMRISEIMRKGDKLPTAKEGALISEVVRVMTTTPGRPGAAVIVDKQGRMKGFFSDGDVRRLLEKKNVEALLHSPIENVMTPSPKTIGPDQLVGEAMNIFSQFKIDQLVVLDDAKKVVGLLDVQDILEIKI